MHATRTNVTDNGKAKSEIRKGKLKAKFGIRGKGIRDQGKIMENLSIKLFETAKSKLIIDFERNS